MRASSSIPTPATSSGPAQAELAELRAARWVLEHEVDSLNETIAVYRQGASALGLQIAALRDELASVAALRTRTSTRGAQQEVEITLAGDEEAAAVVSLVIGEALAENHSDDSIEACQSIASELTRQCLLRHGIDQMLLLRLRHSETSIAIEIVPPDVAVDV